MPFESWRSRFVLLGDEGKWKDSGRIYGFCFFKSAIFHQPGKIKNTQFLLFGFDADTCWQEIVMCCLPPFPVVGPGFSPTLPLRTLSKYQAKRAKIRVSTSNINSTCPMEELSMDSLMLDHLTPETGNKNISDLKVWEASVISLKALISKR